MPTYDRVMRFTSPVRQVDQQGYLNVIGRQPLRLDRKGKPIRPRIDDVAHEIPSGFLGAFPDSLYGSADVSLRGSSGQIFYHAPVIFGADIHFLPEQFDAFLNAVSGFFLGRHEERVRSTVDDRDLPFYSLVTHDLKVLMDPKRAMETHDDFAAQSDNDQNFFAYLDEFYPNMGIDHLYQQMRLRFWSHVGAGGSYFYIVKNP